MNFIISTITKLKHGLVIFSVGAFFCLYQSNVLALTTNCTYSTGLGEVGKPYAIPPANIVLSGNIPDYTAIYTFSRVMLGIVQVSCSGTAPYQRSLTMSALPLGKAPINFGGYTIYPTSVEGLGLSLRNRDIGPTFVDVPLYPSVLAIGGGPGNGGWVDMILWKIPGNLPTSPGAINFTGPTYNQVYHLTNSGDTFAASTDMSYSPAGSTSDWSAVSRTLTGSATFLSGSCNLSTGDQKVQMGTYMHNSQTGYSPWVDASFTLSCPNAYGYGGMVSNSSSQTNQYSVVGGTLTANTIKNSTLTVTIVPRTSIVPIDQSGNPLTGTIALDGTGARGYGVQLAWGDKSTQSLGTPAKPVVFNSPIAASQLNSAFTNGPYAIGAVMPASAIKMAARFIQTGPVQAGPAKASIEVVANYN